MKITVEKVIKQAILLLQLDTLMDVNLQGSALSIEQNHDLKILVGGLNNVYLELASEYFPFVMVEEVDNKTEEVLYSSLTEQCIDIVSIKNLKGERVPFRAGIASYRIKPGKYLVSYTYLPETVTIAGSTLYGEGRVSSRLMSYGVAAEYCLMVGRMNDALMFDKRYKDSLLALNKKKAIRVPNTTLIP